uniref:Uncharacterized protein n=1 Tax=Arundo donax TaxID=35708 RepID=A0A0A8XY79_ARUDO
MWRSRRWRCAPGSRRRRRRRPWLAWFGRVGFTDRMEIW